VRLYRLDADAAAAAAAAADSRWRILLDAKASARACEVAMICRDQHSKAAAQDEQLAHQKAAAINGRFQNTKAGDARPEQGLSTNQTSKQIQFPHADRMVSVNASTSRAACGSILNCRQALFYTPHLIPHATPLASACSPGCHCLNRWAKQAGRQHGPHWPIDFSRQAPLCCIAACPQSTPMCVPSPPPLLSPFAPPPTLPPPLPP
jgi:hypothetical protein